MKSIRKMLEGLTLEDLREWAGSKIYHRGKDYVPCVWQLSRTEDGTLVAWVTGTDEYATSVRGTGTGQGDFDYDCTCPYDYGGPCKHVVALVLAAADQLKRNQQIPLLDPDDTLHLEAFAQEDDWLEEEADVELDHEPVRAPKGPPPQLEKLLSGKSRDELQALLLNLALDFPEVARRLRDMGRLETGQVEQIIRSLRKEIRTLTAQDAWFNPWKDQGNLPDYSHVEEQLQALLDKSHADAVLELGEELWERGIRQVEESSDEGVTALAISSCLGVVQQAVPQTGLSSAEQLLWLVEHELDDEYDLLGGVEAVCNDPRYTQEHWGEVAAVLEGWLQKMDVPESGRFPATYRRERLMTRLGNAYSRSGESQKLIPLLEQEADRCRSYDALVNALLEVGDKEGARQWCIRGFKQTLEDVPGIASGLQQRLRQLAEGEGRFDLAAAYRAEDFFDRPSEKTYIDLRQAAEDANMWPAVRNRVLTYLQTGQRPATASKGKNAWPLPELEVSRQDCGVKNRFESFPNLELLIEIAILEQRLDDAVTHYQVLAKTRRWGWNIDEKLAKAVAVSHPDMALQIWQSIAEGLIGQVKPKAYQQAAGYLRQMHKVYEQSGRLADWKALIQRLRLEHKAKRRLQEVLDGLENDRALLD
ncbi:MAG: hypothetical protein BA869_03360 [Desulfuromonadales bacterium C00003107]|jgi:uncharacterized Zn finger protein|nr:MAG: hypothetical protein BA869_03360 [Desulfuromonadales bacterium C00003107]